MSTGHHKPRVLITRPAAQIEPFRQQCAEDGFEPISLPCIEIEFLTVPLDLAALQQSDRVLFTSVNAVRGAERLLAFPWQNVATSAIGPATERALVAAGQVIDSPAVAPFNSEALLENLRRQGLPRHMTLFKGEGGRELLIDALRDEGVHVEAIEVYRRTRPRIHAATRERLFESTPIDIISVTSDEILRNLMTLAGPYRERLLALPIVCNSERCAELAATLGFVQPARVAMPPGDPGQRAQLQAWLRSEN